MGNILNKYKKLELPVDDNYVNISKFSNNDVGKQLSPGFGYVFDTLIGKVGNLRAAMDYVTTPGYPKKLLGKKKLSKKDIEYIAYKKKKNITNYWAIQTYLIAARIKSDETLIEEIKKLNDDIYITSFNVYKNESLGVSSGLREVNYTMSRYVAAIRLIIDLIKNNEFNDTKIIELIEASKDDKDKPLFDGVPFEINSPL